MDCGADGALYGSCSSQDTWLSASEVPSAYCTGNTRLSMASTDTHLTTALHHSSSDGSAQLGRQRCGEPSVDVVAIARWVTVKTCSLMHVGALPVLTLADSLIPYICSIDAKGHHAKATMIALHPLVDDVRS